MKQNWGLDWEGVNPFLTLASRRSGCIFTFQGRADSVRLELILWQQTPTPSSSIWSCLSRAGLFAPLKCYFNIGQATSLARAATIGRRVVSSKKPWFIYRDPKSMYLLKDFIQSALHTNEFWFYFAFNVCRHDQEANNKPLVCILHARDKVGALTLPDQGPPLMGHSPLSSELESRQ